jgi:hypothetical protein
MLNDFVFPFYHYQTHSTRPWLFCYKNKNNLHIRELIELKQTTNAFKKFIQKPGVEN